MTDDTHGAIYRDYLNWNISVERQRHEWMRLRKSIVATRLRIVVFGHSGFFAVCLFLCCRGVQCSTFVSLGCWSLFFVSIYLLLMEYLHVRMLPSTPPRFVIRKNGLTEYGSEGPQSHWDWQRARQLSIETDRINPAYRSLVVTMKTANPWLEKLNRFQIPLPESERADYEVVAALTRALEDNGIAIEPLAGGTVGLRPARTF